MAGMRSVADGGKDYHLTRTQFHGQMLGNLATLKALRSIPEQELMDRLVALREQFGTSRLGRTDFHAWLAALVQRRVGRGESDIIFDAFDDNSSGGIDEDEFVRGLKSILYERKRSLVLFVRQLLGDVRATAGTIMSAHECDELLEALREFARRKFPAAEVDRAIAVARRQVSEFQQQYQIPTAEFCRALEVSPLVAHVLAIMRDDATLPPSPTPPPTPDPERDLQLLPRVEAKAEEELRLRREAAAKGEEASLNATMSVASGSLTVNPSASYKPVAKTKKPRGAKPAPVLSKLDTTHPGFRADEFRADREQHEGVEEHDGAEWFIRNGSVWVRTEMMGEVPVA